MQSAQAQCRLTKAILANLATCVRSQRLGIVDSVLTKEVTYVATGTLLAKGHNYPSLARLDPPGAPGREMSG